jgi:hypothetical protein
MAEDGLMMDQGLTVIPLTSTIGFDLVAYESYKNPYPTGERRGFQ